MQRIATFASALLALGIAAGPVAAQIPDEFTNLKILPKDIGKRELVDTMRGFAMALGVRCEHCHVETKEGDEEKTDFASDELEPKRVARAMMQMASEINGKLLPTTGRTSPTSVRCVTCHRGVTKPEPLDALLSRVIDKDGVPAAVERYGELRKEYYGSASYDFSPASLNEVAGRLAQEKHDVDGAITIVRLNLEHNEDSARTHLLLGQLLEQKGDREGAIASVKRSLELEPDNRWAKRMLGHLESSE